MRLVKTRPPREWKSFSTLAPLRGPCLQCSNLPWRRLVDQTESHRSHPVIAQELDHRGPHSLGECFGRRADFESHIRMSKSVKISGAKPRPATEGTFHIT